MYIDNLPGHQHNSTFCPQCGETLISRVHLAVLEWPLERSQCPTCGGEIPGIWRP